MFIVERVFIIDTYVEIISVMLIGRAGHTDVGRIFQCCIPIGIIISRIFIPVCPVLRLDIIVTVKTQFQPFHPGYSPLQVHRQLIINSTILDFTRAIQLQSRIVKLIGDRTILIVGSFKRSPVF